MNKLLLFCLLLSVNITNSFADEVLSNHLDKVELGGLESILKKRYLRVLTTKNPYDYYMYQGRSKGIQYEMIKEFVKHLNKKYTKKGQLRIVFEMVPVDFDQLIPMIREGKGDIMAIGLTKTPDRLKELDFTVPYRKVNDVIVTRKELRNNTWEDKVFHVQENSSFHMALKKFNKPMKIETIDPNFNAADLIQFISLKKYDYTMINSFWAKTISKTYDNISVIENIPFRKNIEVSWTVKKGNSRLLAELNEFLPKIKKGTFLGNIFSNKYFKDIARIKSDDFNIESSTISRYDKIFKKYAEKFGFDWRLLAAVAFQESRFDQSIENQWGAIGLFQIKQMTANEPYISIPNISGIKNADNNAHAGSKYLSWIKKRYFDPIKEMEEEDKVRMMLAAYNAGPARVLRAIKKAKKMKLNPNKWFRNVEIAMMKIGYTEPVLYVSEINKHFVSYVLLGIE